MTLTATKPLATNGKDIAFNWITSWDEVWDASFIRQWQLLTDQAENAHVFFTPSVVRAWVVTQLAFRSIKPRFLIAHQAGELVCIFPLVLEQGGWQGGWVRSLVPVGWNSFDYQNPIIAAPLAGKKNRLSLSDILEYCRTTHAKEYDVLRIPFLRADLFLREDAFPQIDEAPFLDLNSVGSLDEITAKLSKGWRQDIRRQCRRLQQVGEVELVTCGPREAERAHGLLQQLMAFHSERWGYHRNESAKHRIATLWRNLATHALPAGVLHVSALRCAGEAIACALSFQYRSRFYFYIPASSTKWANYSPGKVHLAMLLEQAIASRVQVFDFLRGNESYKRQWTEQSVPLYCVEKRAKGVGPMLRTNLQKAAALARSTAKTVVVRGRSILSIAKAVKSQRKGEE